MTARSSAHWPGPDHPTVRARTPSGGRLRKPGVAEEINANRDSADNGGLAADKDPRCAGFAGDHEVIARVLQPPAELFYLAQHGGRTRHAPAAIRRAEPGAPGVRADLQLVRQEIRQLRDVESVKSWLREQRG